MNKKLILVAAAVAGLSQAAFAEESKMEGSGVSCYGANACKGKSACMTSKHSCAGENSCKAQGFVSTKTKEECAKMGGSLTEKKEEKAKTTAPEKASAPKAKAKKK